MDDSFVDITDYFNHSQEIYYIFILGKEMKLDSMQQN